MIDLWTSFTTFLIKYDTGIIIGSFWCYYFYMLFQLWKQDTNNPFFAHNDKEQD